MSPKTEIKEITYNNIYNYCHMPRINVCFKKDGTLIAFCKVISLGRRVSALILLNTFSDIYSRTGM